MAEVEQLFRAGWKLSNKDANQAIVYGTRALEILHRYPGEKQNKIRILLLLCRSNYRIGKYEETLRLATLALALAREINQPSKIILAAIQLAKVYRTMDYYDKAMDFYALAKEQLNAGTSPEIAGNLHLEQGTMYWQVADHPRALEHYFSALKHFESGGSSMGALSAMQNIGIIYGETGQYQESDRFFEKVHAAYLEAGNLSGLSKVSNNLGFNYLRQKKYQTALPYFRESMGYSEKTDDSQGLSVVYSNIGNVYSALENYPEAEKYTLLALQLKKKLNLRRRIVIEYANLARIYRMQTNYHKALKIAREGLDAAAGEGVDTSLRRIYQELSDIYSGLGRHAGALRFYKKFKQVQDRINRSQKKSTLHNQETRYLLNLKQKAIYRLEKEKERQLLELRRQKDLKRSAIMIAFCFLLLLIGIFGRYRMKTRYTRALQKEAGEHRRTSGKLRESEEKFRALAEQSVAGIYLVQEGVIKYMNQTVLRTFGYTAFDSGNLSLLDFVYEPDRPLVSEKLLERESGETGFLVYRYRGLTKDGEILYMESRGSTIRYQGKPAVLGALFDITPREKARLDMLKSHKLEAIGILAGGIAHDFNNLLSVILGNLSMVKMLSPPGTTILPPLDLAENAALKTSVLAKKLLAFSESGWGFMQDIGLKQVFKCTTEIYPELKPVLNSITVSPTLTPVRGDEHQLSQLFINLLTWDVKTAAHPQKIDIRAENTAVPPDNPFSIKGGDYVRVVITGTGQSIAPGLLESNPESVFQRQSPITWKSPELELAICHSIVNRHSGHLEIKNSNQNSAAIEILLPAP